jgi:NAD(P)-dependent dehydrogenase (short-subunit alcohol dehydrogenase family)
MSTTQNSATVVLITGASSGIGLQTALRLSKLGYKVYGTSRNPKPNTNLPFTMLPLNVDDDASVQACLQQIAAQTSHIAVLINNAGYDLYSAAEETEDAELRAQLETNFFGAVRMCKALVPQMRQRQSGKIIQIGSVGGLFALPHNSAYAASKFALEGYSEALRYELLPFGVYVCLIEPGQVNTESLETSVRLGKHALPEYNQAAANLVDKMRREARQSGLKVETVVQKIVAVVQTPKPNLRHAVGGVAQFLPMLKVLMPKVFERMIQSRFGS